MADHESKADELMEKMQKKLASFSFFNSQNSKLEEAEEVYPKAANLYKQAKSWTKAGNAFREYSRVSTKLGNMHQAAMALSDAGNVFKKSNADEAVSCYREAAEILQGAGKFTSAGKALNEVGDLLSEEGDKSGAVDAYIQCADAYSAENSTSQANSARVKAAGLQALLERYPQAIETYEEVGRTSLDSPLLKWNAKDHFFKAGLCHFCTGDLVAAERALEKYCDWDVTFESQREHKLLRTILEASQNNEVDEFTSAVAEFDAMTKLDPWKTAILLRIKESLKAAEDSVL